MIWLTLRQHRTELLLISGLTVLICGVLVITGIPIHQLYDTSNIAKCIQYWDFPGNCGNAFDTFLLPTASIRTYVIWLNLVPFLYGILIGVPLVAREYEQKTVHFIWMQGISRERWFLTKVLTLLVPLMLCSAAITIVMTWWSWPFDQVTGPFDLVSWDFEGVMPMILGFLAFSIGVAGGALTKRIIPAVATTFTFIPLWLVADNWLRTKIPAPIERYGPVGPSSEVHRQDWLIINQIVDNTHTPVYGVPICATGPQCAGDRVLQSHLVYQPLARFWEIQSFEAAILGTIALLLFLVAFMAICKRTV